jgi:hypothetical protein
MLELILTKTTFEPGEHLRGKIKVDASLLTQKVEILLFWKTSGKGTEDKELARHLEYDSMDFEELSFDIDLPLTPYSFTGRLMTVSWYIEVACGKKKASERIMIAPNGEEVNLKLLSIDTDD